MARDTELRAILIIADIIFLITMIICFLVLTRGNRLYKKMRNPRKTVGTVTDREHISVDEGPDYYKYEYVFEDERGVIHKNSFKMAKNLYNKGDNIDLYYDSDCPQKNITEEYLKMCRAYYWRVPLAAVIVVVVPVIIAFFALRR